MFAGIPIGVAYAQEPAITVAITTALGSAPRLFARDTAIDGTIGIVTDRAIPKLKPKLVPNTKKEAVKKIIYDSPRDFHVSTNSNIVTNGINNIAGRTEGNKQDTNYLTGLLLNSLDKVINSIFGKPLLGKPLSYYWNHR